MKYLQICSYIESCEKEARAHVHRQKYVKNMNMVQREIEQIYMQMNKTRKELSSLEGRLEGLTSTLRQMILNEQLVCREIKYTKKPYNKMLLNSNLARVDF